MSKFERMLGSGSTELPDCRYSAEMRLAAVVPLPGGDSEQLYYSLTNVLGKLPDDTRLYPGHNYAVEPSSTIGRERRENVYMRIPSLSAWQQLMG